jgi:O-antigen/teichoic acid export membrane protein
MQEFLKGIGKHSLVYGLGDMLSKTVGFFLIPLYTRYLETWEYGTLEVMFVTMNIAAIFALQGMASALIRAYLFDHAESETGQREVISTGLFYLTASGILIYGALIFWARDISRLLLRSEDWTGLLRLVFLTGFFTTVSYVSFAYLRAIKKSSTFVAIKLFSAVLNISLNIYLVVHVGLGFAGIIYSNLIAALAVFVIGFMVVRRELVPRIDTEKLRGMLSFGLPLVPTGLALWVLAVSDRYFLQFFSSQSEVGLYSLGDKFANIFSVVLVHPFTLVWTAFYFPLAREPKARETLGRFLSYFVPVASVIGLGVAAGSKVLIRLAAPPEYWRARDVVAPLVASGMLFAVILVLDAGIGITRKTKYLPPIVLSAAGINVGLNALLIPKLGMMGAAVATLGSNAVYCVIAFIVNQKLYPVPREWGRLIRAGGAFFLLLAASHFIDMGSILHDLALTAGLVAAYPMLLFISGFFTADERRAASKLAGSAAGGLAKRGTPARTIRG